MRGYNILRLMYSNFKILELFLSIFTFIFWETMSKIAYFH
jgi:hypothetical protein